MVLSSEKLHGDVMPTDLRARISSGLKEAMKNKDVARLATLRLVSAAIKDREIAQRGGSDEQEVTDSDVIGILGKMVKIGVIEEFLPRKLNEDEIKKAVDRAIRETEASSIRDMGRVMGVLKSEYTGRMDFGRVGPMIKDMLG